MTKKRIDFYLTNSKPPWLNADGVHWLKRPLQFDHFTHLALELTQRIAVFDLVSGGTSDRFDRVIEAVKFVEKLFS